MLFPDDFEAEVQRWRQLPQGVTPYNPSPAWQEAQRRNNPMGGILESLLATVRGSQPRSDLGQTQPVATMMGRVVKPGDTLESVLKRYPQGELEGGGMAMGALPAKLMAGAGAKMAMAKAFRPGKVDPIAEELVAMASGKPGKSAVASRSIGNKVFKDALPARLARPGAVTDTPMEKMFAAMIDPKTGQVIHSKTLYRPGDHGGLEALSAVMDGFNGVRGFVDPATMQAFTEAMLEEILLRKHGIFR